MSIFSEPTRVPDPPKKCLGYKHPRSDRNALYSTKTTANLHLATT